MLDLSVPSARPGVDGFSLGDLTEGWPGTFTSHDGERGAA
jgi:hypothetical protein